MPGQLIWPWVRLTIYDYFLLPGARLDGRRFMAKNGYQAKANAKENEKV